MHKMDFQSLATPAPGISDSDTEKPSLHLKTGEFIEEVLHFYHQNRWTFMKLVFPAVAAGTIAVIWGRHESHEISQHLYREGGIVRLQVGIIELGLATWGSYLVSWIAFCFAFGAICAAVKWCTRGLKPSIPDSFAAVHKRLGPFARLSLLLWLPLMMLVVIATVAAGTLLYVIDSYVGHPSSLTLRVLSFGLLGLISLILSRFGLAMPALVLDNCRVWRAILRSCKLTQQLADSRRLVVQGNRGRLYRWHAPVLAGPMDSSQHQLAFVVPVVSHMRIYRSGYSR